MTVEEYKKRKGVGSGVELDKSDYYKLLINNLSEFSSKLSPVTVSEVKDSVIGDKVDNTPIK